MLGSDPPPTALTGCVLAQMPQGAISSARGLPGSLLQPAGALIRALYCGLVALKRPLNSFASLICRH